MRWWLATLLVLAAACASPPRRPDYPLITEDDDPAARAAGIGQGPGHGTTTSAPRAPRTPPPRGPVARRGNIERSELDAVLDVGPGAFLRGVQVDAELVDRRLRGWRIRAFWPGDPRYQRVDLQPGDIVLSVNGRLIVRPEHMQRVWDSLRDASDLVVEVERSGVVHKLEYRIVDSPEAPGSNSGP